MHEDEIQIKRRENEEQATASRARILGLPYLDTRRFENEIPLVPDLLKIDEMHQNFIIPLQKGGGEEHYQFMVTSQTPKSVIDKMRQDYTDEGEKTDFFLISGSAYKVFMLRYDPPKVVKYDDIKIAGEGDSETIASVSQTLATVSTEKVFDFLIDQADKLEASDIHIENLRNEIRIRMRVDGILHPVANIDRDRYRIFMGELSSRASVSMASNQPQSGHMQKEITRDGATHLLNIRVETIPTMYGQDAVLRLFNFDESLLNLDLLGLSKEERKEINEVISHPRGLVLMVGEIRDGDTAKTAIQASITGHLVLSSFHANSTAAAFSRMIDLIGVNPIFSSSIRLVIAQRLVRKLADSKKERPATEAEAKYIREVLSGVSQEKLSEVNLDDIKLYDPVTTEEHPFGYDGRTVIMEQLVVSEDIQAFIRGDVADVNTDAIEKTAKENGMLTLEQKGILAVLRGETTLEEISRVI